MNWVFLEMNSAASSVPKEFHHHQLLYRYLNHHWRTMQEAIHLRHLMYWGHLHSHSTVQNCYPSQCLDVKYLHLVTTIDESLFFHLLLVFKPRHSPSSCAVQNLQQFDRNNDHKWNNDNVQGGPKKRGHSTFCRISRKLLKIFTRFLHTSRLVYAEYVYSLQA